MNCLLCLQIDGEIHSERAAIKIKVTVRQDQPSQAAALHRARDR